MNLSKLISEYKRWIFTLSIYNDRIVKVEKCLFSIKTEVKIFELREVIIREVFGSKQIILIRNDGSECFSIQIKQEDTIKCVNEINELVISRNKNVYGAGPFKFFDFIFLGGNGISLVKSHNYKVIFSADQICFESNSLDHKIFVNQIINMEISGPGRLDSNAGVIGGGVGIEGAAVGIGIASIINALTSKSTVNTILRIEWSGGEVFLHTSTITPEELRIALSHQFTKIKSRSSLVNTDVVSQLEKLIFLKNSGILTESEYNQAKLNLLS